LTKDKRKSPSPQTDESSDALLTVLEKGENKPVQSKQGKGGKKKERKMAKVFKAKYPSPLSGYEDREPLSQDKSSDKSLVNPQSGILSQAYDRFPPPLNNALRGGFDVHIYYFQNNPQQSQYAKELHERIRLEFPELRIYTFWDRPIGPHPTAMFEVNLHTPTQFGAFIPWLAVHRGPLSVLIHPNFELKDADTDKANHTERAVWMGERVPLDLGLFDFAKEREEEEKKKKKEEA